MNTRSCKAKGMRLQKQIIESLLRHFTALTANDLRSIPGSVPGSDIWMSERAREVIGKIDIEAKMHEHLNIYGALKQVEDRTAKSLDVPILVFSKNRTDTYCALKFDTFLHILKLAMEVNK
jgi:hypothetical protein